MFVRGDWARRGLGTRILEACEDAARAEGFRELSLMATLPGELLYRRFGFTAGERTTITLPDGVRLGVRGDDAVRSPAGPSAEGDRPCPGSAPARPTTISTHIAATHHASRGR